MERDEAPSSSSALDASQNLPEGLDKAELGQSHQFHRIAANQPKESLFSGVAGDEPYDKRTKSIAAQRLAIVTLVLLALFALGAGTLRQGVLRDVLSQVSTPPAASLVASRPDVVLVFAQRKDGNSIIVIKSGQSAWHLVSQDDSTAQNPSLSPDGNYVAYTSQRNGAEVVVVSLVDSQRIEVNSSIILAEGERVNLRRLRLCEWSHIAWSPDNGRIAFFSCGTRPTRSILGVADIRTTPPNLTFVNSSEVENSKQRDVLWLNTTQIVASSPMTNSGTIDVSVDTYDVP